MQARTAARTHFAAISASRREALRADPSVVYNAGPEKVTTAWATTPASRKEALLREAWDYYDASAAAAPEADEDALLRAMAAEPRFVELFTLARRVMALTCRRVEHPDANPAAAYTAQCREMVLHALTLQAAAEEGTMDAQDAREQAQALAVLRHLYTPAGGASAGGAPTPSHSLDFTTAMRQSGITDEALRRITDTNAVNRLQGSAVDDAAGAGGAAGTRHVDAGMLARVLESASALPRVMPAAEPRDLVEAAASGQTLGADVAEDAALYRDALAAVLPPGSDACAP